jgi:hypothetical protein
MELMIDIFNIKSDGSGTPTFAEARVQFVINAPPEVGNVTASQNADGSVTINYQVRSVDTTTDTGSEGKITPSFQYCVGGSSCSAITALSVGATAEKDVNLDGVTWTSYTATWYPVVDFPNVYDGTATVKVIADDLQGANRYANSTSTSFVLDTLLLVPPTTWLYNIEFQLIIIFLEHHGKILL